MTNLAIKGIIGVQAMAEISNVLSEEADSKRYSVRSIFRPVCQSPPQLDGADG